MPTVELIYGLDCPNVKGARGQLLRAFADAGLPPRWQEWDRGAPESPAHVRAYGSPTILINGKDVTGPSPSEGASCCRIYLDENGQFQGVPSVEAIASVLLRAKEGVSSDTGAAAVPRSSWRKALAVLPGTGAALLPNLTCPACWPAYAGLLSAFGLGFIDYTPYLFPLTVLFMILALASLGYRAKDRLGYKPFVIGILAAVTVTTGKFVFFFDPAVYGGIALLIGASLWNSWPRRRIDSGSCPICVSTAR
jgi:hypothetical protein